MVQRAALATVIGLVSTGLAFFSLGPVGGVVCFVLAAMIALAVWWPPLRDWLGLPADVDEPTTTWDAEAQWVADEIRAISNTAMTYYKGLRPIVSAEERVRSNEALSSARARYQGHVATRALAVYDRAVEAGHQLDVARDTVANPRGVQGIGELADFFSALAQRLRDG
jgi:hypothetical protein